MTRVCTAEIGRTQRFRKINLCVLPISAVFLLLSALSCQAARIGDLTETSVTEQALRFFTFSDPSLRLALLGCILLGLNCGLLGGFVVVRRMSLVGDTLSHAVLPGIALGFLWNNMKDPLAILIGATLVASANTICSSATSTLPHEQASLSVEDEQAPSRTSATVICTA